MLESRRSSPQDGNREANSNPPGSNSSARRSMRRRSRYRDDMDDDDEGTYVSRRGNMTTGPATPGPAPEFWAPRSGTRVYTDEQWNTNELWYGVGGRLHHAVRRNGLVTRPMGDGSASTPTRPVQNHGPEPDEREPSDTREFVVGFSRMDNPFAGPGRRRTVGARGADAQLPVRDAFAVAVATSLSPTSKGIGGIIARGVDGFFKRYTNPIDDSTDDQPQDAECPICLEPPSQEHDCVQIANIPGCNHVLGRECLQGFLTHSSHGRKECPLCRTEWIAEGGIWEMSGEWRRPSRNPLLDSPSAARNGRPRASGGSQDLFEI